MSTHSDNSLPQIRPPFHGGGTKSPSKAWTAVLAWNAEGKEIARSRNFPGDLVGMVVDPNGSGCYVAQERTADNPNPVFLKLDRALREELWRLPIAGSNQVAWDNKGNAYFVGSKLVSDTEVKAFSAQVDLATGNLLKETFIDFPKGSGGDVTHVAKDAEGNLFLGGGAGESLFVAKFNARGKQIGIFTTHVANRAEFRGVHPTKEGGCYIVAVGIREPQRRLLAWKLDAQLKEQRFAEFEGSHAEVRGVGFHPLPYAISRLDREERLLVWGLEYYSPKEPLDWSTVLIRATP